MTQVTLKTIEQNDNVGMFSICFDGNSESEFEKFLMEFKDNATYNKDFNAILLALSKIIDKGRKAVAHQMGREEKTVHGEITPVNYQLHQ